MIRIVNNLYKDYIDISLSEKLEKFINTIDVSFSINYLNYDSDIIQLIYGHHYTTFDGFSYHLIELTHMNNKKIYLIFRELKYVFSHGDIQYDIHDMEYISDIIHRNNSLQNLISDI